jgi:general secretion pathway protein D
MLTILRADDASKRDIPVHKDYDPDHIPKTPTIVTQIIPVRSLNVVQLVKNLQTLLPSNATISADESANSVILTDTQANIHRIAEIIAALDSVTSGNATIQVFPLKYADAKTLAQLIKDLFPSADTANQNGGGTRGGGFGRFRAMMGMMGGGGGPGGDTGGGDSNGHTPTAKVSAVSDDHSNSLVVSAPDELMPTIERLVNEVDKPVEDTTVAEIFHLKNADPTEMADMLTSLFPDDTNQSDASRQPVGFRGFPGFGGFGQQANNSSPSDRMKKMARVSAVPDRRTSSLIVTAGTNVMEQIRGIVEDLDKRSDRKMKPFAISLQNADPADVLPILQGLFPATTGTSASSSSYNQQNNYLQQRATTQLQNQNNQNSTSGFGTTGSGSRTGN